MIFLAAILLGATELVVDKLAMPTYPFSDADPIPCTETTRYPYPCFDGCAVTPITQAWQRVVLENDKIKITILPEIGGRIWGVEDKATGKNLVYYNHSVKFRNIAQRCAWVSGGIEFNFGIIGHSPLTATPVEWTTRKNSDGSASYFVRMRELICRTEWQVEVRLGDKDDYFELNTTWYNASMLPAPYYQWMNGAFPVTDGMKFVFPGRHYVGHEGDANAWPNEEGHDLSLYADNRFGHNKSYHVVNGDVRHYGVWYPEWKVGLLHKNEVGEKYGRKVWIWSQAREGAIWEDLLTDGDGQYVELQSGRAFNQPRRATYRTPYKHPTFAPGDVQTFSERWQISRSLKEMQAETDADDLIERPVIGATFDWESAYGHYVRGQQHLRERHDREGLEELNTALEKEPSFLPALTEKAALLFRHGRYDDVRALCTQALAIDTYNPLANYLDGYAAMLQGAKKVALERLGLAAYSPELRSSARRLMARAKGKVEEPNDGFVDCGFGRCEFPGESAAERATAYEEAGQLEKAIKLLSVSDSPINQLRKAYLLERLGHKDEATKLRQQALSKSIAGVFPFRREERAPLEVAAKVESGWKSAYYLAVLQIAFGEDEEGRKLLADCGDEPDEWIFYVYRSRNGEKRERDLLRAERLGGDWRVGRDLMAHYISVEKYEQAIGVGERYLKRYPGKNALEILYADALQRAGRNRECVEFLKTVSILPSEFGGNAHDIWESAWLALGSPEQAATYPENLGAGAPYEKEKK